MVGAWPQGCPFAPSLSPRGPFVHVAWEQKAGGHGAVLTGRPQGAAPCPGPVSCDDVQISALTRFPLLSAPALILDHL